MRLVISNIAWRPDEDNAMARLLAELGVDALEVAPTRVWPKPLEVSDAEVHSWTANQRQLGLHVVSMQALLFGRPELSIFGDATLRQQTLDYLQGIIRLADKMGARRLVFGSPRNRDPGVLDAQQAQLRGAEFFAKVAEFADQHGIILCIEPNPAVYGCTWITTAAQGRALVEQVSHRGFALHLDAAAMYLAGDDPAAMAAEHGAITSHFHLSAPQLGHVRRGGEVDDALVVTQLRASGYGGMLSIEMRAQSQAGDNRPFVAETAGYVMQLLQAPAKPTI